MRVLRDSSVTIVFLALTILCIGLQATAGWKSERSELASHGSLTASRTLGLFDYVGSSSFGVELIENWQSEFMQFTMFILATVWLVQRGSSESKAPEDAGLNGDRPPGLRGFLRAHGLVLVMGLCFFSTWGAQATTGWRAFNEEQKMHESPGISWSSYVRNAEFWQRTMQNWQSEFLAVAAMSVFTVYLRELGSPESKRIETPDEENEPTY